MKHGVMTIMALVVGMYGLHGKESPPVGPGKVASVLCRAEGRYTITGGESVLGDYAGRALEKRFFAEVDHHDHSRPISREDRLRNYQRVAIKIGGTLYQARAGYREGFQWLVLPGEILEPQFLALSAEQLFFVIQPWVRSCGIGLDLLEIESPGGAGEKTVHPCNVVVFSPDQLPKYIYIVY